jgi:Flp pilus assembly protein TadG
MRASTYARGRWFLRCERGGTLVEFALTSIMFFLLVCGILEFAFLFEAQMTLQNAVRQAGRYAITGNHKPDPLHAGQTLSRVASITQVAQTAAMGLSVSNIQISSLTGGVGSAGGPGDTVTISVTANLPLLTPLVSQYFSNGSLATTASVSFKNEPFPPGSTQ